MKELSAPTTPILAVAAHLGLHIVGIKFADVLAGLGVVDADERDVVAVGDLRVDGDDRECRRPWRR